MNNTKSTQPPLVRYGFVSLERTFHELSKYASEDDSIDVNQAFRVGSPLTWDDLLKEKRLIILSEAGAGKTSEIRHATELLLQQHKFGFFLRLEHIPNDFEAAFEVGSYESFQDWLDSGAEAWILLDSVDEARLQDPRDFELAVRKLGRAIRTAKDRAHIILTSRTSAWRPKTDLDHCTAHLQYILPPSADQAKPTSASDLDSANEFTKEEEKQAQPTFKIVTLDDLSKEQIAAFVGAKGVEDPTNFLNAVERADAWSFTARPQDLEELAGFWIDKGRIGSRLEIMRNSIERRLEERDQTRADARPLAADRARNGARLLAAATTLTQTQVIRVPDGASNTTGLNVRSVLDDWDDRDQTTLLSRPIFDEAIYGTVRFHHRSVREYLTAEWFADLLSRHTSRRNIEVLFFREQYGVEIITPTLRPILPWLVLLDVRILERVRKVAPEILFEGGDPSQLPVEVRRNVLNEVCEQLANGSSAHSVRQYDAVQRFAHPDLTDEVRALLQKYASDEELLSFLLRMVWLGELKEALPEALAIARAPTQRSYTRTTAFRAVKAIGSQSDLKMVRETLLAEGGSLNREWLAELLKDLVPTIESSEWLLAAIENTAVKEQFALDRLTDGITDFIARADLQLLPMLLCGLNRLLSLPPVVERRFCEISQKFQWLLSPAAKAVERLIAARDSFALGSDCLETILKISVAQGYGYDDAQEIKENLATAVPAWPELNHALFWHEVHNARAHRSAKEGERITHFWQATVFGSFTRFEPADFDHVLQQVEHQPEPDDKLVALSLAFTIYRSAGSPSSWLERMRDVCRDDVGLTNALTTYLTPPEQDEQLRRFKQRESKWKRRDEAYQKKQLAYHGQWREYFDAKLDEAAQAQSQNPGDVSEPFAYLFEELRKKAHNTNRWMNYDWRQLVPHFGETVSRFFRNSAVDLWRNYKPKVRSEGVPFTKTTGKTVVGLLGLEIEASEREDWLQTLSADEVLLACRYASFEINGFPSWLPRLHGAYPEIVNQFILSEVRFELSVEKADEDTHYVIDDLGFMGDWAWDSLAPQIMKLLDEYEPRNLSNLDNLLKIVQGSSVSDEEIMLLAQKKCASIIDPKHLARWLAVLVGVEPKQAILLLRESLARLGENSEDIQLAMTFSTYLWGRRHGSGGAVRDAFLQPDYLKELYLLLHEYIRLKEDIDRAGKGVYSPELRDHAQDARNRLFEVLNGLPGKEAFLALHEIACSHPDETARTWMARYPKEKAERDGDLSPWTGTQVREFYNRLERTPNNHRELFDLARLLLLDLRDDLENGDSSLASILLPVRQETEMRKYIAQHLRERADGRYGIPQEEELADAKRPDLRFLGNGFDGPVPVELKLSDKWTGPALIERLENQLCHDYLRDARSSRGIFVLVHQGGKMGWEVPGLDNRVDFPGLVEALQSHWSKNARRYAKVDEIFVVGIDLTKRAKRSD